MIEEMPFFSLGCTVLTITFPTQSEAESARETAIHLSSVFKYNTLLNSIIVFGVRA